MDPEHMIGRDAELQRTFDAFASVGVILTGERRLGKTSLALLVALKAREHGWDVVRQSAEGFQSLADFSAALIWRLDESRGPLLRAASGLRERWTLKGPGVQIAPATAPRLLDDIVTSAVKASRKRLLLILDELPVLARELERATPGAGMAMLHTLRRLRQEHPDRLRMLCLGSIGFHHVLRGDSQGALNELDPQRLGPLSHDDATYLAACIFRHGRAPAAYERLVAPVVAEHAEGAPYYVHQIVADIMRDHPARCSARDVERIVDMALVDPDDRWDLRHYFSRVRPYYGEDAPLAGAILDDIAGEPSGVALVDLLRRLGAHRQLAPIDEELARDVIHRLEADHYLVRDAADRRRFAFELVRRAWIARRT